jgi:CRP-like cAMP-binding protein
MEERRWYECGLAPDTESLVPADKAKIRNKLLSALPQEALDALLPKLQAVELPRTHVLVEPDVPSQTVCFIENGLASLIASSNDDEKVEVGHIGREGVTGHHVLLQTDRTPSRTFMQVEGDGFLLPVSDLTPVLEMFPQARDLMLRYVHCCEIQLSHSALANARYNIPERLARCLLMVHDRVDGNHLPLTHEFLALMIGVRRSGVTNELHVLEGVHAIRASRGNVEVRDRAKLLELAGGSYGLPEREYARVIGAPISDTTDE